MAERRAIPVYLSLEEAAEAMSVSVKTIRRWIAAGTLPAYRCGKRAIRIKLEDLEAAPAADPLSAMVTGPRNVMPNRISSEHERDGGERRRTGQGTPHGAGHEPARRGPRVRNPAADALAHRVRADGSSRRDDPGSGAQRTGSGAAHRAQVAGDRGEGRREKQRSRWLNRLVVGELSRDPDRVLAIARDNIARWREIHAGRLSILAAMDRWSEILDEGVESIVATLTGQSEEAEDLRQNSPFAGVLSQEQREQVLASFRSHWKPRQLPRSSARRDKLSRSDAPRAPQSGQDDEQPARRHRLPGGPATRSTSMCS